MRMLLLISGLTIGLSLPGVTAQVGTDPRASDARPSFNGSGALLGAAVGVAGGTALGAGVDRAIDGDQAVVVPIGAASGAVIGFVVGGRGRPAAKRAAIGFAAGALAGAGVGFVLGASCTEADCSPSSDIALAGAGIGAVLGAAIGSLTGGRAGAPTGQGLFLVPGRRGLRLGATIAV